MISRAEAKAAGETLYFTGKPCPAGHVDARYVSSFACRSCAKQHHQRYRRDPEFMAREQAAKAAYRAIPENRQKDLDYAAKRWREDPEHRARCAANRARRRAIINERQSAKNHTPERAAKAKAHRRRMYEKFRDDRLARAKAGRGIRKGAEGKFTKDDIAVLLARQRHRCATCDIDIREGYHVDHIMPLSKGGSNWPSNLQCLCPPCNLRKKDKHPIDWAQENGRLL